MFVDPRQIAKMITEDPDEVNPLDDIRDEYAEVGTVILPYCACGSGKVYKKCCRENWSFCSSDCAREQRDKLKIEIERNP